MIKKSTRIIAGKYRLTPIIVKNNVPGLRPTQGRIRETLFNWLHHFWQGKFSDKRVLDLFAGSGSIGFEAASRGFGSINMIEKDKRAASALLALKHKLKANNVHIRFADALRTIENFRDLQFDLILIDPPFNKNLLARIWPKVPYLLRKSGFIYLESDMKPNIPEDFKLMNQGKIGKVYFFLFKQYSAN